MSLQNAVSIDQSFINFLNALQYHNTETNVKPQITKRSQRILKWWPSYWLLSPFQVTKLMVTLPICFWLFASPTCKCGLPLKLKGLYYTDSVTPDTWSKITFNKGKIRLTSFVKPFEQNLNPASGLLEYGAKCPGTQLKCHHTKESAQNWTLCY